MITVEDQSDEDFDARLGKQLGGYMVVARVADGAMGRVFEGRHPETKARVAIKVLHEHVARDKVAVERFKREYETAKEMSDPHVVKVLEFGDTPDGSHFLTMEYLEGEELSKQLAGKERIPRERVVRVVCQTALALEHAHSFGFIHRDLKPDNIFLCKTDDGADVRVLDFGSVKLQMETGAKLTAFGTTLGSPYYMSPEQATGAADVDQRTDVFALGAILYEAITGKIAFEGPNVAMILMKIMNETPPPASSINPLSPVAVDDVIDKALRKDKKGRYEGTVKLAEALLAAYGLSGSVSEWATKPELEIRSALEAATPAAPKPFGQSLPPAPAPIPTPPAAQKSLSHAASERGSLESAQRPSVGRGSVVEVPKNNAGGKLIAGLAAAFVVILLLVVLMR